MMAPLTLVHDIQALGAASLHTTAPELIVGGSLKVASFNLSDFFNGNGLDAGFPSSQKADISSEINPQRDNLLETIQISDADIIGLVELKNDGYSANSTIQDLVADLNELAGVGTYAFIDPGLTQLGNGETAVGLIYQPSSVTPVGEAATLITAAFDPNNARVVANGDGVFEGDGGLNHPPLAQAFQENATGEIFTTVVTHLKSRVDPDQTAIDQGLVSPGNLNSGDGQAAWNERRTEAAIELADWLETEPTRSNDSDILVMGNLNAYTTEDPPLAFENAGYINLIEHCTESAVYTLTVEGQSGYLDHALANTDLMGKVSDAAKWRINADNPAVINYDDQLSPPDYNNFEPDGSSDHNSVIISLNLARTEISGTKLRDELTGTSGDDIIIGFGGLDHLTGGKGYDDFVYTNFRDAADIITDFEVAVDQIVLTELFQNSGIDVRTYDEAIAKGFISLGVVEQYTAVFFQKNGGSGSRPLIYLDNVDVTSLNDASNFVIEGVEVDNLL